MKSIVYVDMDGVLSNYSKRHKELQNARGYRYPQSTYGFFRNLELIEGAKEAIENLKERKDVDLYILSSPSYKNPLSYSEKREWIEREFGLELAKNLILSTNKGLNKGDFLIDDNIEGNGQENFEGEVIQFGCGECKNWEETIRYLDARLNNKFRKVKMNLLVIRSQDYHQLSQNYQELLGINFVYHQHGKGPFHYSTSINGLVFEIYEAKSICDVDATTRLGFEVDNVTDLLKVNNFKIVNPLKKSEWGLRVVLKDSDGRKIEITEK